MRGPAATEVGDWLESSFVGKDLGLLLGDILRKTWRCSLAAMMASCTLGCISEIIASNSREIIIPIYLALVRMHLECYAHFGAL